MVNKKIYLYIFTFFTYLFLFLNHTFAVDITTNTTISTGTTYDSLVVKNGATLTLNDVLTVTGDATIENGGIITHTSASSTAFTLIVGGTLTIDVGGKIDTSTKGVNSASCGSQYVGASHGAYGSYNSKAPYGDIYNPITVGSYGYTSSYSGGGLIRMTVGNLVNSGSILANGKDTSRGAGAGGSINITVSGNISGSGVYQAIGGTSSEGYPGAGGRIAIKYGSVFNLTTLKSKISASGPSIAGEGTIYIKDLTSGYESLIIKGDGGNYGTFTTVNLNNFDDVVIDGGNFTASGSYSWNIPKSFTVKNYGILTTRSSVPLSISGSLTLSNNGKLVSNSPLTISSDLILLNGMLDNNNNSNISNLFTFSGGTVNNNSGLYISSNINFLTGALYNDGTLSTSQNAYIRNYSTVYNNKSFLVSGDLTVLNGGNISHETTASTAFNLIVGGTLTIDVGGKIDTSTRGANSASCGSQYAGASHGAYGSYNSSAPYDDIYNPISVGAYGRSSSYYGGGLVRMTVGNLVNSGSILANGKDTSRGAGAGGSINITVSGNISGS
ncbi:MAG: hypothetical protein PHN31_07040, partial [Candidatus Gracilibacteria bacterium]|nr:hypothetical protein [Candidatus Gracilibacteria bacterium]